jgi:hypothetical protein
LAGTRYGDRTFKEVVVTLLVKDLEKVNAAEDP